MTKYQTLLLPGKPYLVLSSDTTWVREVPPLLLCKESMQHHGHKPLVSRFSKDVTTLSQWLQHIMLIIHQYRLCIINKPHPENRDQEMTSMNINVSAIRTTVSMAVCTSIQNIQAAIHGDTHLQKLR